MTINQAVPTPQIADHVTPRLDYALNRKNTLMVRYQELRIELDNQGIGDFNLASRAYNEPQTEHTVQVTETAMISPRAINETRFQYLRRGCAIRRASTPRHDQCAGSVLRRRRASGNSGATTDTWELTNTSTYTRGAHASSGAGACAIAAGRHVAEQFRRHVHLLHAGAYRQTLELQRPDTPARRSRKWARDRRSSA